MIDKSTRRPQHKEIHMISIEEITQVRTFDDAIKSFLENCPSDTAWVSRGSKLYGITVDDKLDLATKFKQLNDAINAWPKAPEKLEKVIAKLSEEINTYYELQTKEQQTKSLSEPSTPERKNSLSSNSDQDDTSVGSSLSSSPEDAASIAAEPAAKQEIIDYKAAIAKFKKACVEHNPAWLQKALDLYNVLSNDNLIDDASKYDALIKKIEAWGKVNNPELAIAIVQLESNLKAFYETTRISKPFFQRTNSLESGLLDLSTKSVGSSSSSSSDKSPTSTKKPRRKVRQIDLESADSGETTGASIKTNPTLTANTTVQSSPVAFSSADLQRDPSTFEQLRPATPVPFTSELPFDVVQEQNSEEIIDAAERSASPISDSPASASSRSGASSPALTPSKDSPNISPIKERNDQSAEMVNPLTPRARAETPEPQTPVATSTNEEPARSTTPQRQPSPALEIEAVAVATTPVTNQELIESRKQRWDVPKAPKKDIVVEDEKLSLRQEIEMLTVKATNLEIEIKQLKRELTEINLGTPEKRRSYNLAKEKFDTKLKEHITLINEKVEAAEETVKAQYAIGRRWGDFIHSIPLIKNIPFIKRARERRATALADGLRDLRTNRKDLYVSHTLINKAANQTPEQSFRDLDEFRTHRGKENELTNENGGVEIFLVHSFLDTFCKEKEPFDTHTAAIENLKSSISGKEKELSECNAAKEKALRVFNGQIADDNNSFVQSALIPSLVRR